MTLAGRFAQVPAQGRAPLPQAGERRLGHDGLKECGDELTRRTPSAGPGRAGSGGLCRAGSVLERVDERLDQQDHQEMAQNV